MLGLAVTAHLYNEYPDLAEGQLAKIRASVVSSATLVEVARDLDLGRHLLLGKGETAGGGADKSSILADAMEAVIGAVFLDAGLDAARSLVSRLLHERIVDSADGPGGGDFKTVLQELAVQKFADLPTYELSSDGPDHARQFEAVVTVGGDIRGRGSGLSKKQAEQAAARQACATIEALSRDSGSDIDAATAGGGPR